MAHQRTLASSASQISGRRVRPTGRRQVFRTVRASAPLTPLELWSGRRWDPTVRQWAVAQTAEWEMECLGRVKAMSRNTSLAIGESLPQNRASQSARVRRHLPCCRHRPTRSISSGRSVTASPDHMHYRCHITTCMFRVKRRLTKTKWNAAHDSSTQCCRLVMQRWSASLATSIRPRTLQVAVQRMRNTCCRCISVTRSMS